MTQNKIKNTRVGDDIHFYINGNEDRGIVVKMSNEYVTVFKESTQNYEDIHINDTFFIKDIMVNKQWNDCSDQERYDMLVKIHAPSPRYLQKTWEDLPKDIKELLQKNNSNQVSFKNEPNDENVTARTFDQQKTDPEEIDNNFGKQSLKAEDTEKASSGDIDTKAKLEEGAVAGDITAKRISGGFKEVQHIKDQKENPNIKQGKNITTRQGGTEEREPSTEEQKGEARGGKGDSGKEAGDTWMKYFRESQSKEASWSKWLETRQEQVLKGKNVEETQGAYKDEFDLADNEPLSQKEEEEQIAFAANWKPTTGKDGKILGSKKSIEELIAEVKSSVENSVHGNAARNPTAGVNTNTNFDAPADYEGFSHSGVRPEQFKHEEKKPKVGKEKKKKDISVDDKPADRVNSQTNKYETNTENKDTDGRATNQVKDKI